MPSGLYLGFGEFGRKLAITMARMYMQEKELNEETSVIKPIICFDFYPGVHFDRDLKRFGLMPIAEDNALLPESTRIFIPEYKQLPSPSKIALDAGVGSFWPLAAESVIANWPQSRRALKSEDEADPLRLREVEFHRKSFGHDIFIFSASSSGGTGNGSCPEFVRSYLGYLSGEGVAPPRILPIAVTVLPFGNDPRLHVAEPNALTFLGRIITSGVKTLFIADNEHFARKGLSTEAAEAKVNELLAHSLASLLLMDYAGARRWEAADYVNFFAVPGRASITVPSFNRIEPGDFAPRALDAATYIPKLLYFKIIEGLAAEIDFKDRPPKKALLLVILPRRSTIQLSASALGDLERELNSMLVNTFGVRQSNVTIITGAPISDVWISAYFLEPYVYRLKEIHKRASRFFKNYQDVSEHVRRMIESIGGSPYVSYMDRFVDWIEKSYEQFTKNFDQYTTGSSSRSNPCSSYVLTKIPVTLVTRRSEKTLSLAVCYLPTDKLREEEEFIIHLYNQGARCENIFTVREFCDRKISETIDAVLKILNEIQAIRSKNNDIYRVTLRVGGYEIPIPPEILQYSVTEIPERSELALYLPLDAINAEDEKIREARKNK